MSTDHSGTAPLAATLVSLVAFFFCVLTSTAFKWYPVITGPLTVACAVALVVSVVWLNRWASRGDGEDDDEPERRPECPYKENCGENHPELPEHGEREQS